MALMLAAGWAELSSAMVVVVVPGRTRVVVLRGVVGGEVAGTVVGTKTGAAVVEVGRGRLVVVVVAATVVVVVGAVVGAVGAVVGAVVGTVEPTTGRVVAVGLVVGGPVVAGAEVGALVVAGPGDWLDAATAVVVVTRPTGAVCQRRCDLTAVGALDD